MSHDVDSPSPKGGIARHQGSADQHSMHATDGREPTARSHESTPSFVAPSHYLRPHGASEKSTTGGSEKSAKSMSAADIEQLEGLVGVLSYGTRHREKEADIYSRYSARFEPFSKSEGRTMFCLYPFALLSWTTRC